MFTPISEGVKEIGEQMINNPKEWVQGQYEFINTKHSDLRVWTANGVFFIKFNGNDCLSWKEKRYINRCIKKSIANRLNLLTK